MLPGEILLLNDIGHALHAPKTRGLGQFAEEEIILPDGPRVGRRLQLAWSPPARLLYAEMDSGRWRRTFITGINQDGKSLFGFVIPTMHLLFERRETAILGVPSLDLVSDKWRRNLLPVIKASKYADQLPTSGSGSRGGDSILYEFKNGTALRFMTAGGGDQSRASFTTKNLLVTETDGFDDVGGSSREGDKFSQLVRRTLAFGDESRLIAECTLSTEEGRTCREIKNGSNSRIALKCPHCAVWVTPEREHLVGWQDAENEFDARANAHLACPNCGAAWTNEQRIEANHHAVLVHKGQTVSESGEVVGPLPRTDTLGFRWSVVNSILKPERLSMVAIEEWKAQRAPDEDAAERDLLQSQWAMPAKPLKQDVHPLDYLKIMQRVLPKHPRGMCPDGTQWVTVGIDCGKWLVHWDAIAWQANATPHVPAYGVEEVHSDITSEEEALMTALRSLRDEVLVHGWQDREGRRLLPAIVFVDEGEWSQVVRAFCNESGPQFFSVKGYGVLQRRSGKQVRETGTRVIQTGENYAVLRSAAGQVFVEANVDKWKSWLHSRWQTPIGKAGALTLYDPSVSINEDSGIQSIVSPRSASIEHLSYAKHQVAEKEVMDFDAHQGTVTRWEVVSRKNHHLDGMMLATVAGHAAGVRLIEPSTEKQDQENSAGGAAGAAAHDDGSQYNPLNRFRGRW